MHLGNISQPMSFHKKEKRVRPAQEHSSSTQDGIRARHQDTVRLSSLLQLNSSKPGIASVLADPP